MRVSYTLSLLATIVSLASSQTILPAAGSSTFPACALSCQPALQAQQVCTPPNAIVSTQQTYSSCFCQAPFLADLYTTGETVCASVCTATADKSLLSSWFIAFCKDAGVVYSSGTIVATAPSATASTSSPAATTAVLITDPSSLSHEGPWIKSHWQWIIMLIFLFFGLTGIWLGARWYKKRHDRKQLQKRAAMSGFPTTQDGDIDREAALSPEMRGASSHADVSRGFHHNANGVLPIINEDLDNNETRDKSKRSSRVAVTEVQPVPPAIHTKEPKN